MVQKYIKIRIYLTFFTRHKCLEMFHKEINKKLTKQELKFSTEMCKQSYQMLVKIIQLFGRVHITTQKFQQDVEVQLKNICCCCLLNLWGIHTDNTPNRKYVLFNFQAQFHLSLQAGFPYIRLHPNYLEEQIYKLL